MNHEQLTKIISAVETKFKDLDLKDPVAKYKFHNDDFAQVSIFERDFPGEEKHLMYFKFGEEVIIPETIFAIEKLKNPDSAYEHYQCIYASSNKEDIERVYVINKIEKTYDLNNYRFVIYKRNNKGSINIIFDDDGNLKKVFHEPHDADLYILENEDDILEIYCTEEYNNIL